MICRFICRAQLQRGLRALVPVVPTITGFTRSNNTVTVTTSAAHGIKAGALVNITVSATGQETSYRLHLCGLLPNRHRADCRNLHLHFGNGHARRRTCGILRRRHCVLLRLQLHQLDRACGRLPVLHLRACFWHDETPARCTKTNETWFEDYGSTYSSPLSPKPADFVPSSPPASSTNQYLVTTISSGAGTTSLVLANEAVNSVSGAKIKYDCAPNILTAANAHALGYALYFPRVLWQLYVIKLPLDFSKRYDRMARRFTILERICRVSVREYFFGAAFKAATTQHRRLHTILGVRLRQTPLIPTFVVSGPSVYIGFVSFATQDQGVAVVQVGELFSGSYHNCDPSIRVATAMITREWRYAISCGTLDYTECLFVMDQIQQLKRIAYAFNFLPSGYTRALILAVTSLFAVAWVQRGVLLTRIHDCDS